MLLQNGKSRRDMDDLDRLVDRQSHELTGSSKLPFPLPKHAMRTEEGSYAFTESKQSNSLNLFNAVTNSEYEITREATEICTGNCQLRTTTVSTSVKLPQTTRLIQA
jgi:hypothetical protein